LQVLDFHKIWGNPKGMYFWAIMHFSPFQGIFKGSASMGVISVLLILGSTLASHAQSSYLPLNEDIYYRIERYETKSGRISPDLFTGIKPYRRADIIQFVKTSDSSNLYQSKQDRFNRDYFLIDSWELSGSEGRLSNKKLPAGLYKSKSDMLELDREDLNLHLSPVLHLSSGMDRGEDRPTYTNTRGFELRSTPDKKIGLYTFVSENQTRLPGFVQQTLNPYRVVPHEALYKKYKNGAIDFLHARAHISFRATKNLHIQFGHDRNFIGNGFRSLVLSDYSAPYFFLKTNLKVWKVNYQWQLSRLNADILTSGAGTLIRGRYPQKFMAFHQASINLGKKVNLSVFESVIFSPKDTLRTDYFDVGYLNPVIFYRAVEQQFGSPDNVIIGMDGKWMVAPGLTLYGQIILDEFVLSNIKAGDGWWGNKYAYQGGFRMTDVFGIKNLDVQGEYNVARPYTFSQSSRFLSYTHYRQPLAHPAGANFREWVGILRYQPASRLNLTIGSFFYRTGKDGINENWGGDILKPNNINRAGTRGNTIGQGQETSVMNVQLTASWMIRHNLFVDVQHIRRNSESELPEFTRKTNLTSLALRLNIARRSYDF